MSKGKSTIRLGQTAEELQRKPVSSSFNPGGLEKIGQAITEASYSLGNKWMQKEEIKQANKEQAMQKQAEASKKLFMISTKNNIDEKMHEYNMGLTEDSYRNPAKTNSELNAIKEGLTETFNNSELLDEVSREELKAYLNNNTFSIEEAIQSESLKIIKSDNEIKVGSAIQKSRDVLMNNFINMSNKQIKAGMLSIEESFRIGREINSVKYSEEEEIRFKEDLATDMIIGKYSATMDNIMDSNGSLDNKLNAIKGLYNQVKGNQGQAFLNEAYGDSGLNVIKVRDMLQVKIKDLYNQKKALIEAQQVVDYNKLQKIESNNKIDPINGFQKKYNMEATLDFNNPYIAHAVNTKAGTTFTNSLDAYKYAEANGVEIPVLSKLNGQIEALANVTNYKTAGSRVGQIGAVYEQMDSIKILNKPEYIQEQFFLQTQEATGIDKVQYGAWQKDTGNYDFTVVDKKIADIEHGAGVDLDINVGDYALGRVIGSELSNQLGVFSKASKVNVEMGNNYSRAQLMIQKRFTAGFLQNADAETLATFSKLTPTEKQGMVLNYYNISNNKKELIKDVNTILGAYTENRAPKEINGKALFVNEKYKNVDLQKGVEDYSKQELYYQDKATGQIMKANPKDLKKEVVAKGLKGGEHIQPIFRGSPLLKKDKNGELYVDVIDLKEVVKPKAVKQKAKPNYNLYGLTEGDSD